MNKYTKIAIACAATYAVIGLNTFGYKYHHPVVEELRNPDAAFAGIFWPGYWAVQAAIKVWEPPAPAPATNVMHIHNYIHHLEVPYYGPSVWTNAAPAITNWTSTNISSGRLQFMSTSNVTYYIDSTNISWFTNILQP